MIKFTLFSAVTPVEINPGCFTEMTPEMKTQAVRLLAESGIDRRQILKATGLNSEQLGQIEQMRHCVVLAECTPCRPAVAPGIKGDLKIPLNAQRALMWFFQAGEQSQISYKALEAAADLGQNRAADSLDWLIEQGYLAVLGEQRRKVASTYQLTNSGREAASALNTAGASCSKALAPKVPLMASNRSNR